jgi:hypothetical protein
MTLQAQILPGVFQDLSMRVVTGRAVETVRTTDLMRMRNLLKLVSVLVALVTNLRCDRPRLCDVPRSDGLSAAG